MRRVAGRLAPLAIAAALAGCDLRGGSRLAIAVDARHADQGAVEVSIEVRDASRDSVRFRGYAASALLALSDVSASGTGGRSLPVRLGVDSVSVEGGVQVVPTVTVAGPLPAPFTLRYRVRPGTREGNAHTGFLGARFGYAGPRFVFVTGRNLFLLPEPDSRIRAARVRFQTPPGWRVESPWWPDREGWRAGFGTESPAEHLITASIGIGRFDERSVALGAPSGSSQARDTLTLAFETGIPPADRDRAALAMAQAARAIDDVFQVRSEQRVVIVPETPEGDELEGEGWANGQGGTLAPLTPARLERFARRLIETRTLHQPFRTQLRDPADYWLVDAITRVYAWRALARIGWADDSEVAEDYGEAYVDVLRLPNVEMNLERLYQTDRDPAPTREIVAPTALLCLERALAAGGAATADSGGARLDRAVRRVFSYPFTTPHPVSFWESLPAEGAARWAEFRRRFVQGHEALPVETLEPIAPLAARPSPPGGAAVRRLTLAFTGNTFGYLENCGCKVNQSGGLARRATAIAGLRRRDPHLVLVDAGNAFVRQDARHRWDGLAREEQRVYLGLMAAMRVDAVAVGTSELAFGADTFAAVASDRHLPYVAANVPALGRPVVEPWRVVRAGELRVAIIGLVEPPRGRNAAGAFAPSGASLEFTPALDALRRELPAMRKAADLVVAIGRLRPATIRRLASACPGLDVVISTDRNAVSLTTHEGRPLMLSEDESGFAGRTAVLYTTLDSYGLGVARLAIDGAGRVVAAPLEELWLDAKVADDPGVRRALDRFYEGAGRGAAGEAQVPPLFADDSAWNAASFAGAARCASCHAEEHRQWLSTGHAQAYKTLLDVHRHYQPHCVVCHVVGFRRPGGFRIEGGDLTLAGVQCEDCHGPGAAHAARPAAGNIRRAVPERVCLACHDPDHSDRFVYSERLPRVVHRRAGASAGMAGSPPVR